MNKYELAVRVSKNTGKPMSVVEPIVNCVFDTMADAVLNDEKVSVSSLGSWSLRPHGERVGYDPSRRLPLPIPAGKSLRFAVSPSLGRKIKDRYDTPVVREPAPAEIEMEEKTSAIP